MIAVSKVVITKFVMLLLALMATPMESGDSIRVDRLGTQGVEESFEIEKTDEGYALYAFDASSDSKGGKKGDKRADKKKPQAMIHAKDNGSFELRVGKRVVETVKLKALMSNAKPGELAKADDKRLVIKDGGTVHLQRRGEVLYLTSNKLGETYVVTRP